MEGEEPEFSFLVCYVVQCRNGNRLVFWTTAEPVSHAYKATPIHKIGTQAAINDAFQFAFFHWGIHAWAVYSIVALVLLILIFIKGIQV